MLIVWIYHFEIWWFWYVAKFYRFSVVFFFAPCCRFVGRKFSVWWLILRAVRIYLPFRRVARICGSAFAMKARSSPLMLMLKLNREFKYVFYFGILGRCITFFVLEMAELLNPLPTLSDRISILYNYVDTYLLCVWCYCGGGVIESLLVLLRYREKDDSRSDRVYNCVRQTANVFI